jgi:hypothetical protein
MSPLHKRSHRDQRHQTALNIESPSSFSALLKLFSRKAATQNPLAEVRQKSVILPFISCDPLQVSTDGLSKGSGEIIHKFCPKTE